MQPTVAFLQPYLVPPDPHGDGIEELVVEQLRAATTTCPGSSSGRSRRRRSPSASMLVRRCTGLACARLASPRRLEAESIHIFREVAAEFERPVLLFSGGKDSIVMLRLAEKAFWPAGSRSR